MFYKLEKQIKSSFIIKFNWKASLTTLFVATSAILLRWLKTWKIYRLRLRQNFRFPPLIWVGSRVRCIGSVVPLKYSLLFITIIHQGTCLSLTIEQIKESAEGTAYRRHNTNIFSTLLRQLSHTAYTTINA